MMRLQKKVGFIGAGAMGSAIVKGLLSKQLVGEKDIVVAEMMQGVREKLAKETNVRTSAESADAVVGCDVTVLCVKPHHVNSVIDSVKQHFREGHVLISIAAGVSLFTLQSMTKGRPVKWARAMPNIACTVGQSASAYALGANCSKTDERVVAAILSACGLAVKVPEEKLLDACTGVAGSGIAYVFLFAEALADGGVRAGLPRPTAMALAHQTILGAATMLQTTNQHPGLLKDMVCSPGGTTIEAVSTLERMGLRTAVIEAVYAASEKSVELGLKAAGKSPSKL
ncbi:Pyrroline-5-carboxylate reductase [Diplonema papillatum]|nr:Pyrroline-5-carboxylate reductase [Diplonema papillatum]